MLEPTVKNKMFLTVQAQPTVLDVQTLCKASTLMEMSESAAGGI